MIVRIVGEFSRDDLKKLAKALREIEQKIPNNTYLMMIEDDYMTTEEAMKLVWDVYKSTKEELP